MLSAIFMFNIQKYPHIKCRNIKYQSSANKGGDTFYIFQKSSKITTLLVKNID